MYNSQSNSHPPQGLVLRFMREKRKLSLLNVGRQLGVKPKVIDHIENGRKIIPEDEIITFLEYYKFSIETFNEMVKLKPLTNKITNHYFLTRKL